ncbi:MAG: tetratricopeptide repeat protein [Bryobacteraceae bacterium]|nr:tetratricopeptide repeat protein [Bryobacteraceae bacterium]
MKRCLFSLVLGAAALYGQPEKFQYPLPSEDRIQIRKDLTYKEVDGQKLQFDLYTPKGSTGRLPVVIFVNGVGADFRPWVQYVGWSKAVTSRGLAGVNYQAYDPRRTMEDSRKDFDALVAHLRTNAESLGIDMNNFAVWSCSANSSIGVPISTSDLAGLASAVIYYGAGEAKQFPLDRPVLLARAGLDNTALNRAIDSLAARAVEANAPWTVVNLPGGHHGFDVDDDNEATRLVVGQTLDFLAGTLKAAVQQSYRDLSSQASAASLVNRRDWPEAIRAYQELAKRLPRDSEILRQLGAAYLGAEQWQQAVDTFQKSLDLGNRNRGNIAYQIGIGLVRLGRGEEAIGWLEKLPKLPRFARDLRTHEVWQPVRSSARFQALLATFPAGS